MSNKRRLRNWSLYCIIDRETIRDRGCLSIARAVIKGGARVIQLRDHCSSDAIFFADALLLRKYTRSKGVDLIINNRVDIAKAVDADGVHLGKDDMPVTVARRLLGKNKIIGYSTHSLGEAKKALKLPIDYISIGPVYKTPIKHGVKAAGIELVRKTKDFDLPVVVIGGINRSNIAHVKGAGASIFAVIRAFSCAPNPTEETKCLIRQICP